MRLRRVVTGHDDTGKAVVVSDEDVQPTDPDFGPKWSIWAADAPVVLPDGGARPDFAGPLIPRPGCLRARRHRGRPAPGDWLIVNGVTHSWRNDRDEPAVMVGIIIGAEHKGVPLRKR